MKQPLIFPLSNPTSQCEISAEDAYKFSKGQCVFAAGSPFGPVELDGKTLYPGQANNVLCFPGVGFGAVLVKAKKVPPGLVSPLRVAACGMQPVAGCSLGGCCRGVLCEPQSCWLVQVTDEMLLAAAVALADYVSEDRLDHGNIYPELADLREISPVVCSCLSRCLTLLH